MIKLRDNAADLLRERCAEPDDAVRLFGLELKPHGGRGRTAHCPACDGGDLSIRRGTRGTLQVHCYRCSAGGDLLALAAMVSGRDLRRDYVDVVVDLGARLGVEVVAEVQNSDVGSNPRNSGDSSKVGNSHLSPNLGIPQVRQLTIAPFATADKRQSDPDRLPADVFHALMRPLVHLGRLDGSALSARVCEYLDGRGVLDAARADGWFAIGPDAGELLCDCFGVELVQRAGLCNARGKLKWSEWALAIPWRTPDGLTDTIQRRHLGECDPKLRYVFPTKRGPLHPYAIERLKDGPIVLCEGAMDVLARRPLDSGEGRNTLGVPGVSGWSGEWSALVAGRTVLIAYDDDRAGNEQALALAERLYDAGAARVQRSKPKNGSNDWAEALNGRSC